MMIRIPALKEGLNQLEESVSPEKLGLEDRGYHDPLRVTGEIDHQPGMLDVRLHIETVAASVCDRCAVAFDRVVAQDTRVMVLRRDAEDADEEESEGLIFIGERSTEVDLSEEIAEAVLLAEPLQVLCREDCKGLCPYCYVDLNEETCGRAPHECLRAQAEARKNN